MAQNIDGEIELDRVESSFTHTLVTYGDIHAQHQHHRWLLAAQRDSLQLLTIKTEVVKMT